MSNIHRAHTRSGALDPKASHQRGLLVLTMLKKMLAAPTEYLAVAFDRRADVRNDE